MLSKKPTAGAVGLLLLLLLLAGCATDAALTAPAPSPSLSPAAPESTPASAPNVPVPSPATPVTPTPMPSPTATTAPSPTPTPPPAADLVAFESYETGDAEIVLLDTISGQRLNLTRHPAGDRAPAWSPDGKAVAFESDRDGNWEIYLLRLEDGSLARLTDHPAYDGAPAWSPDGVQIAFESYRDGNLEVYTLPAQGGEPRRLTRDPAGDFGPAWSPDGRQIAFTSWRDGNKEIYAVPAAGGQPANLTRNPADDEDPAWVSDGSALAFTSWRDVDPKSGSRNAEIYLLALADAAANRLTRSPWPDSDPSWDAEGRLLWAAYDPGAPFETYDPHRPGGYHLYRASAAGLDLPLDESARLAGSAWDERRPAAAPAQAVDLERLEAMLPSPRTPTPTPSPLPQAGAALAPVVEVPTILASYGQIPVLVNEWVAPSLVAWQQDVLRATGWDFLHMTLGTWRTLDDRSKDARYAHDYRFLSWHKAGRALDLALEYKVDGVDQVLLTREDLGASVYWRFYLRASRQDGSQGEPLKENPWLRWWWIVPEEDPAAYAAGGKRLPIPQGYYVDITALARRHGWERIASYAVQDDYDWHTSSNATEYWHYERTDGLTWWDAMRQIYPAEVLQESVGWDLGLRQRQSEEMMRSKGVPAPPP